MSKSINEEAARDKLYEIAKRQGADLRERFGVNNSYGLSFDDYCKKYGDPLHERFKVNEAGEVEYWSVSIEGLQGGNPENGASVYGFPLQGRDCEGYIYGVAYHDPLKFSEALKIVEDTGSAGHES